MRRLLALALLLSGSAAIAQDVRDDASLTSSRISVMTGDKPEALLNQCSRDAPAPGEAYFQPNEMEVMQLDGLVTTRLMEDPKLKPLFNFRSDSDLVEGWNVTVLGITRGGKDYLYGSYEPSGLGGRNEPLPAETSEAPVICDGGPRFFGAEMDMEAVELTHIAFNGGG